MTGHSKPEDRPAEEPPPAVPNAAAESRPRIWPRVVGVLILFAAAGGAWVWQYPDFVRQSVASIFPGFAVGDSESAKIAALDTRVARLEQRPAPDLTALTQRLDALERRTPANAAPPADQSQVLARLGALEAQVKSLPAAPRGGPGPAGPAAAEPDLHPLLARLDALEKNAAAQTLNVGKLDALAAKVATLSDRDPAAAFQAKLDQVDQQLHELSANEAKLAAGSGDALRLARLEIALNSGHPLGPVPNAPPALTRFATAPPPTLAELRLSFAAATQAALRVSVPDTEGKPFLDRMLARLQDFRLITVREGGHVVVGNAAADALAHAGMLLNAGDLSGAIKAVSALSGPPAAKMAAWLSDATALQAAREALVTLAGNG